MDDVHPEALPSMQNGGIDRDNHRVKRWVILKDDNFHGEIGAHQSFQPPVIQAELQIVPESVKVIAEVPDASGSLHINELMRFPGADPINSTPALESILDDEKPLFCHALDDQVLDEAVLQELLGGIQGVLLGERPMSWKDFLA